MIIKIDPKATNDIAEIYVYLCETYSARLADQKITQIYSDIDLLAEHPFMGKSIDGHDQNFRQFFSNPNVIIYDINDKVLEILHIVDARMDYVKLLV